MQRRTFLRNGLLGIIGLFAKIGFPVNQLLGVFLPVAKPALPTTTDSEFFFSLTDAVRKEQTIAIRTIKSLVRSGADVNVKGKVCFRDDMTVLHYATAFFRNSNMVVLKCLVSLGADVNAKAEKDKTPLHQVVWNQNENVVEVIKFLVSHGANVNAKDMDGYTPLDYARKKKRGNTAVIEYLSKHA